MISMLRKEACSGSIHDLAHIPNRNCLADCLTKASAKADNLITAAKTRRLLDLDIHPDVRTLMEHKAHLSAWCRTFMFTRENEVFFLNTPKISFAPTPPEGPFRVMFVMLREMKQNVSKGQMQHHVENQQTLARTAPGCYSKPNYSILVRRKLNNNKDMATRLFLKTKGIEYT